ncbi:MAG: hypothetical protein AAFR67_10275, partial [Chloroflexota bacterium]
MADATATSPKQNEVATRQDQKRADAIAGWTLVAPAVIIFVVFLIVPLIMALYFSFTDWSGTRPLDQPDAYEFVG